MNKFSKQNVYSTQKILSVKSVSVKKVHGYGHLEEVQMKRADRQLYKFKEGDFVDLHFNDIKDMLILVVQHKLSISTIVTFLGYNDEMLRRKWTDIDKKISELTVELIDKQMRERRIVINLEALVVLVNSRWTTKRDATNRIRSHDPARTGGIYPKNIRMIE
ncbi:hypothetical protein Tco_1114020 [Tanacetum coccineum]|uniref:Uncharacterized protein n=1 Tax=Tanacetum coccineum TaxID=301880 RepID=A0ABQ5ITY3_9ASTR